MKTASKKDTRTRRYVNELSSNTSIEETFVLSGKEMRTSRVGKTYLVLRFSDKTGSITGYHFAPSAYEAEIPVGAAVTVRGVVGEYKEMKKITVEAMAPAPSARPAEFLAYSKRPRSEMLNELRALVASVTTPSLARLLRAAFGNSDFLEAFCDSPASSADHHAYLGGLLEHTVSVATLCEHAARHYPHIQKDVLVSAAILHDIGQVDSLEYDTTIRQTAKGRLLGHAMLSLRRVREAAHTAGVDEGDQALIDLEHAIVTHHGEDDGGGHKPATLEAVMLYDINATDIHTAGFIEATRGAVRAEENWTSPDNQFKRPLFVPKAAS